MAEEGGDLEEGTSGLANSIGPVNENGILHASLEERSCSVNVSACGIWTVVVCHRRRHTASRSAV